MPVNTSELASPWTEWWQEDLPCQFSQMRAAENRELLIDLFGLAWIRRGIAHPGAQNHPFFRAWLTSGAGAFFELNVLAEDLRVVASAPGFETILHDLRIADLYQPTNHTAHIAALFARGGGQLVQFFSQDSASSPDFIVNSSEERIAVEAKLFRGSDKQDTFERYAGPICDRALEYLGSLGGLQPFLTVIVKDVDVLPPPDEVLTVISSVREYHSEAVTMGRTPTFNIFIEDTQLPFEAIGDYAGCLFLCPRAENENLRIEGRSKKAAGQLRRLVDEKYLGLLCLGVNEYQQPNEVATILTRRFDAGQYTSISAALLVRSGPQCEPPERRWVDLLAFLRNPNARQPLRTKIRISPLGIVADLTQAAASDVNIPAYRVMAVSGTLRASEGAAIFAPDVCSLRPELLE